LLFFLLGLIVLFFLLYALRSAIVPFVFGLVLVYLLLPIISWAERNLPLQGRWRRTKRVALIVVSFIVILGLVGFFSYYVVAEVIKAFVVLVEDAPDYISQGLLTLQEWTENLRQQFPAEMQQQVDQFILNAGTALGNAIRGGFMRGVSSLPDTFSLVLGFAALPIFLFYLLKDSEKIKSGFYAAFPAWLAEHVRNVASIIELVLGRYIRAQLMLGFIVAYFCFVGLLVLGIDFAPALAAFAGLTELIPILGPWIGGAAAVIVTLAIAPEKVAWVIVLYLSVQLVENSLLVPRIQGGYLRVHPAAVVVLLALGAYFAGFWGLIVAVPLAATIIEIYKYVRRTLGTEEVEVGKT